VSPDDVITCEERFSKSKTVSNIMTQVSQRTNFPIEKLYEEVCWPLDKKYGHCFDAFKLSIS
jgi:translation initiation factor 2 subunit 1